MTDRFDKLVHKIMMDHIEVGEFPRLFGMKIAYAAALRQVEAGTIKRCAAALRRCHDGEFVRISDAAEVFACALDALLEKDHD